MSASLDKHITNGVVKIEIVNEKKKNAMTPELLDELGRTLEVLDTDPTIRAVLLTGRGEHFCTGMDVEWFRSVASLNEIHTVNVHHQDIHRKMAAFSKPIVAALKGYTLGQGLALALYSDIRIASEDVKIGMPEIKLGFPVMMNCIKGLSSVIGMGRTKEILFLGDIVSAHQALAIGLVNCVVPKEALKEESFRLASRLAHSSPTALTLMKRAAAFASEMSAEACFSHELSDFNAYWETSDRKEGFNAFFEKREPSFTGK
jgi:enoyl-CoA hydratase / 3-hydroxyacyl-CoA dehydrogenase